MNIEKLKVLGGVLVAFGVFSSICGVLMFHPNPSSIYSSDALQTAYTQGMVMGSGIAEATVGMCMGFLAKYLEK